MGSVVNPRTNDLDGDDNAGISEAKYRNLEIRTVLILHRPGSPMHESLVARLPRR